MRAKCCQSLTLYLFPATVAPNGHGGLNLAEPGLLSAFLHTMTELKGWILFTFDSQSAEVAANKLRVVTCSFV